LLIEDRLFFDDIFLKSTLQNSFDIFNLMLMLNMRKVNLLFPILDLILISFNMCIKFVIKLIFS